MSTNAPSSTSIEVTPKHNILAWILIFFQPTVVVDGNATKTKWGQPFTVPVAPGQHQVQVHFKYIFLKTAGKAISTVTVQPGETSRWIYKAPWVIFLGGKLKPAA